MGFEILETETKKPPNTQALLTYMRRKRKDSKPPPKYPDDMPSKKNVIRPQLWVTLPTVIVITEVPFFTLMVGSGEHVGKMRIIGTSKEVKGSVKGINLKHSLRMNFGYVPLLGDEIFAEHRSDIVAIDRNTYEIDVGKLFANQTVAPPKDLSKVPLHMRKAG